MYSKIELQLVTTKSSNVSHFSNDLPLTSLPDYMYNNDGHLYTLLFCLLGNSTVDGYCTYIYVIKSKIKVIGHQPRLKDMDMFLLLLIFVFKKLYLVHWNFYDHMLHISVAKNQPQHIYF
eukprot:45807_1